MKRFTPSRLLLQANWDEAVGTDEAIWVGYKMFGSEGKYDKLHSVRSSLDPNIPSMTCSDVSYQAKLDFPRASMDMKSEEKVAQNQKNKSLPQTRRLTIGHQSLGQKTTFLAPVSTYDNLHKSRIYCVDVSRGSLGVSSDDNGKLLVWDTETKDVRRSLAGHCGDVYSCQFFPSGLVVLSGGADTQLKVWSVETGDCPRTMSGHTQAINDLGFVDRGRNVISCAKDGSCRLWDCGSGDCVFQFNAEIGALNSLSLVSSSVVSCDTSGGDQEFGTGGKMVAIGSETGYLTVFGLNDKSTILKHDAKSSINVNQFLSEFLLCFGTENGYICVMDVRKPDQMLYTINDDRGPVLSLCPIQQHYWISFGDGTICRKSLDPACDGAFSDLELTGSDCDPIYRIRFDGRHMYSCCRDKKIRKYAL